MNEIISFRVSPETVRIIKKFIHGVQHELDSIPAKVGVSVDLSSSSSPGGDADGDDSNTPSNSLPFNGAVVVVVKKFEIVFKIKDQAHGDFLVSDSRKSRSRKKCSYF
jgi:hypothetical protein